jgi:catechol 2,3-dioxygenase-like lactoylglutathione lyase family enzyme
MAQTIAIERVDHIGIRVRNLDRALAFYGVLRFELVRRAGGDDVAIIRNEHNLELNLVFNANAGDPAANILMDVPEKFPGYTHIALRVASIPVTIAALKANDNRDQPGTGQLRRKRPRLGVRARPGSQRHRVARPRPGRGRGCYSVRAIRTAPLGRPGPHTVQSPNQLLCSRLPIRPPLSQSHTRTTPGAAGWQASSCARTISSPPILSPTLRNAGAAVSAAAAVPALLQRPRWRRRQRG